MFIEQTLRQKAQFVSKNKLRKICINSHGKKRRYKFMCSICDSRPHKALIHCDESSCLANNDGCERQLVNMHIF